MIEEMRSDYHLAELCDAMEISSSGYYKWRASAQSARSQSNEVLLREINKIHQDQYLRNYRSPRMTVELNNRGYPCSENRVARLMAREGISAHHTRRWKPRTTIQNPGSRSSDNLLAKMPELTAPGQVWVSDITYVFTRQQTHYLAVIMDLFTREILGWELASHMEASLVQKALQQAETKQGVHPERVFHSDRGSQYTSDLLDGVGPYGLCAKVRRQRKAVNVGAAFGLVSWSVQAGRSFWRVREAIVAYRAPAA